MNPQDDLKALAVIPDATEASVVDARHQHQIVSAARRVSGAMVDGWMRLYARLDAWEALFCHADNVRSEFESNGFEVPRWFRDAYGRHFDYHNAEWFARLRELRGDEVPALITAEEAEAESATDQSDAQKGAG